MLTVEPVGLSGGIALLWKVASEVAIQTYSRRHISAMLEIGCTERPWLFTGFYGDPDRSRREESWRILAHLRPSTPAPWLCVGDFNEIWIFQKNRVEVYVVKGRWNCSGQPWKTAVSMTWATLAPVLHGQIVEKRDNILKNV
ncbi:hypothetical protein SLA2020_370680 [Shorea laevis]